jgi:oxaloacetate decarboxylase beta subunit
LKESGVVDRLSDTTQNALINIVTIFLGLAVGSKLMADKFLQPETLGILVLGMVAFNSKTES